MKNIEDKLLASFLKEQVSGVRMSCEDRSVKSTASVSSALAGAGASVSVFGPAAPATLSATRRAEAPPAVGSDAVPSTGRTLACVTRANSKHVILHHIGRGAFLGRQCSSFVCMQDLGLCVRQTNLVHSEDQTHAPNACWFATTFDGRRSHADSGKKVTRRVFMIMLQF